MEPSSTPTVTPQGVTHKASAVTKYYADLAIKREYELKEQKTAIDGGIILGASLGALIAFIFMKPEDAMLVLGGEVALIALYKSFDARPEITKTTPVKE